jgi:hypothetical protein
MNYHAKKAEIQTPARLADNLIGSLGGLTAIKDAEIRRQIVMLINHSYALGFAAGAGAGLLARIQLTLAVARRRAWQGFKFALSAIRARLAMIFRNRESSSQEMLAPPLAIQYPMRRPASIAAVPLRRLPGARPAALRRQGPVVTDAIPVRRFHNRNNQDWSGRNHGFTRTVANNPN